MRRITLVLAMLVTVGGAAMFVTPPKASAQGVGVICECESCTPDGGGQGHMVTCCNNTDLTNPPMSPPSGAPDTCGSISIGKKAVIAGCVDTTKTPATATGCIAPGVTVDLDFGPPPAAKECGDTAVEACEACGCSNSTICLPGPCRMPDPDCPGCSPWLS